MTQTEQIKNYLEQGNSLTPLEALDKFNCFRLSGRIHEIRAMGINVASELVSGPNGKKWARYWISKENVSEGHLNAIEGHFIEPRQSYSYPLSTEQSGKQEQLLWI